MRYSSARYFYRKSKQDPSRNWSDVYKSFWGVSLEEYIEYAIKEKLRDSYEELECHYTKK
jgi:hypothetical protein